MQELILVILLNLPGGQQIEQSSIRMGAMECLIVQAEIWNGPNEVAYVDDIGPVPFIDAACVPVEMAR